MYLNICLPTCRQVSIFVCQWIVLTCVKAILWRFMKFQIQMLLFFLECICKFWHQKTVLAIGWTKLRDAVLHRVINRVIPQLLRSKILYLYSSFFFVKFRFRCSGTLLLHLFLVFHLFYCIMTLYKIYWENAFILWATVSLLCSSKHNLLLWGVTSY